MARPVSERINRNAQALLGILPSYEPRTEYAPFVIPVVDVTFASVWERARQSSSAGIDTNVTGAKLITVPNGEIWAILNVGVQVTTAGTGGVCRISFYMIPRGTANRVFLRDSVSIGDAPNSCAVFTPENPLVIEGGSVIGFDNLAVTTTGVVQMIIHYILLPA